MRVKSEPFKIHPGLVWSQLVDGLTPRQSSKPSPAYHELAQAEQHFASLVRQYTDAYPEPVRPFAVRVAKAWAFQWVRMPAGLAPNPGQSIEELEAEIYRARWRRYYRRHRDQLLVKRRRNYHHKRTAAGQTNQAPGPPIQ